MEKEKVYELAEAIKCKMHIQFKEIGFDNEIAKRLSSIIGTFFVLGVNVGEKNNEQLVFNFFDENNNERKT